jgi:hypothetical protein
MPVSSTVRKITFLWGNCTVLLRRLLEHDPEKHALGLDPMGGYRFSEKIMLH